MASRTATQLKRIQTRVRNKRPAFLAAFRRTCNITLAAKMARIDRSLHYQWMKEPDYAAEFADAIPEATGTFEDAMHHWALVGLFEPNTYQGRFQYATRTRVMCVLADGTTAFADELPKGAKVVQRRTVHTNDGEILGTNRRSEGIMMRLAAAWMPEKYGTNRSVVTGAHGAPLVPSVIEIVLVQPSAAPQDASPSPA